MPEAQSKSVLDGMAALLRDNPWPEFEWGSIPAEYFSLDAGGRELVVERLKQRDAKLMIEVGCFMCGSTLQWLRAKEDLTIVGVDPWAGNWAPYIGTIRDNPRMCRHLQSVSDTEALIANTRKYGNFIVALNNVRAYRDRFVPVRQYSPEALSYLASRKIAADIIFIDAFKRADDVEAACRLFPKAIVCGDDWNWRNEAGEFQMQKIVNDFAAQHGYKVIADRATWVLER